MQNVGQVKSFVDDLIMKRGTVSMRVTLVLRSAEVQPLFRDLCICLRKLASVNSSPPLPITPPLPDSAQNGLASRATPFSTKPPTTPY